MSDWQTFQADAMDALRQYRGFMEFFETAGSLSNSRPDALARITREEKKEIWILDAKSKKSVSREDKERMEKYIEMIESRPMEVGLEVSELSDHELRPIFITRGETDTEYESVNFRSLHQFIQRELLYTDTDKLVRDIAGMVKKKELNQSQARLLNNALKPFRDRLEEAEKIFEKLKADYTGLELYRPPFNELEISPPCDAVIEHDEREGVFLVDVPYSRKEAKKSEERAKNLEEKIPGRTYYVSVHSFESDSEFACRPENFGKRMRETLGILSADKLAEIFSPKFEVEKSYGDGFIELKSDELGFRLEIRSENDIEHEIRASMSPQAVSEMKERSMNSRASFGEFQGNKWIQRIEVTEDNKIKSAVEEPFNSYREKVRNIFQASVNPVYSRKIAKKV